MSILVCVTTTGSMRSETAEAAFAICANHPDGASFRTVRAMPTDRCRNICAQNFLQSPHSHILFLDADVVPPVECLHHLLAANSPVSCGIYPIQIDGAICLSVAQHVEDNAYAFYHDAPPEPFEIDAAGLGCCLIAREVFERIEAPWFQFIPRPDGGQIGEDIYFFERCADVGIKPIAVPHVLCGHHRSVEMLGVFKHLKVIRDAGAPIRAA